MPTEQKLEKISSRIGLVTGLSDILAYISKLDPILIYTLLCVTIIALLIWVYTILRRYEYIRAINTTGSSLANLPSTTLYKDYFQLISYRAIVELQDSSGKVASCEQRSMVRCLKNGANRYHFRFAPAKVHSNFVVIGAEKIAEDKQGDGVDVIVELHTPCKLNESRELIVQSTINDAFLDSEEFICVQRYYNCVGSYMIELIFPQDRQPKTYKPSIIINDDYQNPKPTINSFQPQIKNGKLYLSIDVSELKVTEKLLIKWKW